ncbi:MAG: glycoside hydrolase family 28 protein [Kiritimatiellae bacterium]|nr:glycoside hydrolase family 28 protein [Kiritimatiellia bacterium]
MNPTSPFDIRAFGAVADDTRVNTAEIQAAIDACASAGGGTVLVTGGVFLTGTLILKSRIHLHIESGSVLKGSLDIREYARDCGKNMYRGEPEMDRCLLFARDAEQLSFSGGGVIDGNGAAFPNADDPERNRPMLLRLIDCRDIHLRDLTLRDPAGWTSAWLYCRHITVDGIRIHSRVNDNGDGLDFDGCTDVRVANSSFDTSDDCICLQTSRPDKPCTDITVTNCTFCSKWAGLRIGLLSRGDFDGVCVSNCVFHDIQDAGLKIQVCEGGDMRNMSFSNLVMRRVPRPVFMTLGRQRCCVDAPEGLPPLGKLRRISFHGLHIDNSELGPDSHFVLTGLPGACIEDVSFSGVRLWSAGGGVVGGLVPELTPENLHGHWPEYFCFQEPLPASGLYARHVRNLRLEDVDFRTEMPDARPAVVLEDVTQNMNEKDHFEEHPAQDAPPPYLLQPPMGGV